LTTYSRKEGCGFAEWDAGCHSWIVHGKAMSSRCQEAESALLAMPLKQGKALSMREPVVAPEISLKKIKLPAKRGRQWRWPHLQQTVQTVKALTRKLMKMMIQILVHAFQGKQWLVIQQI
jgi:hypothetical protein